MTRLRPAATAAPALIALLVLTGCTQPVPADTAPPAPSTSEASPTASPTETTPAPPSEEPEAGVPDDWQAHVVGDGHTSWSLPPGWTADIESTVVEGNAEWTDYEGLIRDDDGTPMLRFRAIASGGQYATDSTPCERPETEVYEILPLGEQVSGADADVVTLAHAGGDGRVVFAAGISDIEPTGCEPGILSLGRWTGYDFLLLQIVADNGMDYPTFASFDEARAYLDTEEYAAIRGVLASFEFH